MKTVIVIWCRYKEKTPMKESQKLKILKQEQVSEYDKDEKSSQTEKEEAEAAVDTLTLALGIGFPSLDNDLGNAPSRPTY